MVEQTSGIIKLLLNSRLCPNAVLQTHTFLMAFVEALKFKRILFH